MYSANAFGDETFEAYNPPPGWFGDDTQIRRWEMPRATVATWPYEEMYKDKIKNPKGSSPKYDAKARRRGMQEFFDALEADKSLVFYYANYSNPFSEEEHPVYVLVGLARLKAVGPELTWVGQSERTLDRYGPNVWVNVTSHYPDQGLRIPYHRYRGQADVLRSILWSPENPREFKYASRHITDDGALGLVERAAEVIDRLIDLGDETENWAQRREWLGSLMAELWSSGGLRPGLGSVLDYLGFQAAIPAWLEAEREDAGDRLADTMFAYLDGN